MKVLFVEDDFNLGEALKEFLEINNIAVKWLDDDREVENVLLLEDFDVIVLDLILRYRRGEDILQELRKKGLKTPILVLTAKKELEDKEVCFERGADDYLTKPFAPQELLWRLKALTRRGQQNIISFQTLKIDLEARTVTRGDEEVKLSRKEWEILCFLLKHRGKIVSKDQILNYVWGETIVGEEVVRTYIKNLRKLLPEICIETYKGRGYRLK